MKTLEYLDSVKGKTVFTVGTGNNMLVFSTMEDYELWCEDNQTNPKVTEHPVYEKLNLYTEVLQNGRYTLLYDYHTEMAVLKELILSLEHQLSFKNDTMPELPNDIGTVEGMWRWVVRRPGESERLYESDWRLPNVKEV